VLDGIGKFLPIFKLRASEEEEILGIDDVEIGEFAVSSFEYPLKASD
jgi:ammonium transporter, Amt family